MTQLERKDFIEKVTPVANMKKVRSVHVSRSVLGNEGKIVIEGGNKTDLGSYQRLWSNSVISRGTVETKDFPTLTIYIPNATQAQLQAIVYTLGIEPPARGRAETLELSSVLGRMYKLLVKKGISFEGVKMLRSQERDWVSL